MAVTVKKVVKVKVMMEGIMEDLEGLFEQKQEVLDNAEARDYPNETKIDELQNQVDILEEAKDGLVEVINKLEEYE